MLSPKCTGMMAWKCWVGRGGLQHEHHQQVRPVRVEVRLLVKGGMLPRVLPAVTANAPAAPSSLVRPCTHRNGA